MGVTVSEIKFYEVGGCVRDRLLGRTPNDIDFVVVGSTPEEMIQMGFKQVGSDFPVFLNANNEEFALARTERKTGKGYHGFETDFDPSVTLQDDLLRRDLTINAMAQDLDTKEIIDPFGGQKDLKNGILRHITDSFAEDPLRVLRVARFQSRFGFEIAPETVKLMARLVDCGELDHLTPERVWLEMEKAIMEDHPVLFFWALDRCCASDRLFPEVRQSLLTAGRALRKSALHNADKESRFMILCSHMNDADEVKTMLERVKAPNNVVRLAFKFRLLMHVLENWEDSANQISMFLHVTSAYQNPDDLFKLAETVLFFCDPWSERMDKILAAFRDARTISFGSLSSDQRSTLKGHDIGVAINHLRIDTIEATIKSL